MAIQHTSGADQTLTLSEGQQTQLSFSAADIKGMRLGEHGSLIIGLKDGHTVTIVNFHALAGDAAKLALADGTALDAKAIEELLAKEAAPVTIAEPAANAVVIYELLPGQKYHLAFDPAHTGGTVTEKDGSLVITFGDHGQIILKNFDAAMNGGDSPLINHDNGSFLSLADFLKTVHVADAQHTHANDDMADAAQKLAGIEPAAGGNGAGGGGAGGHDFNSQIDPAGLNSPPPVGPIGLTELHFGLPIYPQPLGAPDEDSTPPGPHITINGGPPDAIDAPDAIVKEDGSITIPITASIGAGAPSNDVLTVTVTGIPGAAVGTFSSPIGTYDAAHGTWTVTLPAGHDLNTTFTFTPAHNSDADFSGMHATASQFDPATGTTQTAGTNFHVTTDAVADIPTITADNPAGNENTAVAVHIAGAVTDLDGSESVTGYTINGVPAGFSFNHGTDLGGGVWSLSPSDVTGLTMTSPANFYGTVSLGVTVNNAETTLSGNEVDLSDNTNHASTDFSVTWNPIAFPPTLEVNNGVHDAIVKEDGTVTVPVTATLDSHDSPNAVLTVTVTGIDNDAGTFSAPIGTYTVDPATHIGTWTYTAAPGTEVSTAFTFTPNHDSDVDFANLHATATAFEPATSTSASSTADAYVTTDAVADVPTITVHDAHGAENTTVAVSISGAVTDTDGSETVTGYQVSGVPAGFSFNHGTDLGGGVWSFSTADVTGLTMSSPTNYTGTVSLTATVLNAETSLSGNEADFSDNTNHADAAFTATWDPIAFPPTVSVNNGIHDAVVKEDGSITVPVTATLNPLDSPNAVLTVTVTGIHNDAGTFSAPIGTYTVDPATHIGTWTVTLAPGADLSTAFTFTPVHNGDYDFGSLNATATAYEPATGTSASSTASAYVTTDAVADVPDLTASTPGGEAGHTVALNIATAVTDTDGSEVIDHIQITNLPAGATLTAGTLNADGSWTLTTAQLTGLGINLPHGLAGGTYTLNVESVSHEQNLSGNEVDLTDNYNHADVSVALNVTANPSPIVTDAASTVDETNLAPTTAISSAITANFGIDAPGSFAANNVFSAGGSLAGGALTSDGHAVTVTESGNVYTGTANGATVFTLTLNANGTYNFVLDGTFDHADHSNPNDAIQLNFGVTATDSDGDHGTGTIHVTVLDDAPTAHNDVNSFFANIGHTSGNVVTGAGEAAGGADALSHDAPNDVTQVQFGTHIVNVPTAGTATIDGTYGELVISADGSYTYTLGAGGTAGGGGTVDTVHHFTGNTFPASLPESVPIADPSMEGELHSNMTIGANTSVTGTITFDGAGYTNSLGEFTIAADGTLQAAQMIAPSITGTGTSFSATAGSGAAELGFFLVANGFNTNGGYAGLDLAHGSLNFIYDYGQADQRAANVTDAGAHVSLVFTDSSHHDTVIGGPIYFTSDRGGSNSLNADGVVHTISGVDGTDASGSTLKIGFEDLPNGGDNDYNDTVFTVHLTDHSATPPGSDQFLYKLTDGDGDTSQANLTFNTLTPPTITITVNHGNPITSDASVQSPDAVVKENHSVTVPVTATLSNPSSAGEALTVIVSGIPNTVGTVTAADGGVYDAAHGTITWTLAPGAALNSSITFTPTAFSDVDFGSLHVVATAHDALSGTVTASSNIYVTTDAVAEIPGLTASNAAEEAGHTTALVITTHEVDPDGSEVISGLTISGLPTGATLNHGTFDAVHNVWNLSQADLTGLTVTTAHGTAAGNYTLTVTSTSTETTLSGHEVDFTDNSATATTTAVLAITANPSPIVTDASSTVDETNLAPATAVSSAVTANFGIDGPGTFAASNVFSSSGSLAGGALTSGGHAVTVTEVGNVYTGTANGHTVFTMTLATDGHYTFNLLGTLDHADHSNPNDAIQLNFGVTATDSDGDHGTGTIHVTVLDDAPIAHDDNNSFNAGISLTTTGNVITGVNGGVGAADTLSHDAADTVTQIQFGTHTVNVPTTGAATIDGTYGELKIAADGTYNYTLFPGGTVPQNKDYNITLMLDVSGSMGSATDHTSKLYLLEQAVDHLLSDFHSYNGGAVNVQIIPFDDHVHTTGNFTVTGAGTGFADAETFISHLSGGGTTNYEAPLQSALTYLHSSTPIAGGTDVSYFITDGEPNTYVNAGGSNVSGTETQSMGEILGTDGTNEVSALQGFGSVIGVGINVGTKISNINEIDSTGHALNVTDPTQLDNVLHGSNPIVIPPATGTDQFVYTLTDGDGDSSHANLNIHSDAPLGATLHVNNDVANVQVKEDSSVFVAVTAHASGDGGEHMTLTLDGVGASWGFAGTGWTATGVTGEYQLSLAAGVTDYNGGFTFTPAHNSDVDLAGLHVTASVAETGQTTASTTANFGITTDAVVDTPVLTVSAPVNFLWIINQTNPSAIPVSTHVTDTDGSETVDKVVINLNNPFTNPVGTYTDLADSGITVNKGTETAPGVWTINVGAQDASAALSGLSLLTPTSQDYYWALHNGPHSGTITVQSFVSESHLSGGEFDLTDNTTVISQAISYTFSVSPLVVDMNGNGFDLVNKDAGVKFDMTNDGQADHTSWVAPSDGLLAIDANHNGVIDNQSELFGTSATASDGFANLAQLDANHDGVINAKDAAFGDLLVWQDANQDGVSQATELHHLGDLGIASISLSATAVNQVIGDSGVSNVSAVTYADGHTTQIGDAWFNVTDATQENTGATLEGVAGSNNVLQGTQQNDTLISHGTADALYGYGGADHFVFGAVAANGNNAPVVKDFNASEGDALDLSLLLSAVHPTQATIDNFVHATAANGNTTIAVDVSGSGIAANFANVAVLQGVANANVDDLLAHGNLLVA